MSALMWRASGRYMLRHRWQIGLSLLGVALGVAVVVAVDLAGTSAQRAFALSRQILEGPATHQIVGGPAGLPQGVYRTLRVDLGLRAVTPVIEGEVRSVDGDEVLQLTGIDPFAGGRFHRYLRGAGGQLPLARLLTEPATGLLTAGAAARLGVKTGQALALQVGTRRRRVTIIGLLRPAEESTRHALSTTVLTDIATAQEILGRAGHITRIDLIVPRGRAGERELARIRAALPPGARIIRSRSHTRALAHMTHAFRSNLAAMSLLALVVGVFLVYNTMTFSVVQRRHLMGLLRALGATRREIFSLVLGEAFAVGCLGTLAGLTLGVALGHGLVHLVTRTINDLYFSVTVSELVLSPATLLKGAALGVGLTLLAAWLPALEATRAPPRAALSRSTAERRAQRSLPAAAAAGGGLAGAGGALLYFNVHSLTLSYAAALMVILGFALLTPPAVVIAAGALRPLLTAIAGPMGAMVTRGVIASLSRTGVAIAALTVAIATTVAVGVMIGSFRDTLAGWLKTYLRADVYVSAAGSGHHPLPSALTRRLVSTAGVAAYSTGRYFTIDTDRGVIQLMALHLPPQSLAAFRFKEGDPERVWRAFKRRGRLIVSEAYAYHHRLHAGDPLTLPTGAGPHTFTVAGVFYHYGSDQGVVFMSRDTYRHYWHDSTVTSLGLYARPGVDPASLSARLRRRAGPDGAVEVRTNRTIRQLSMRIFDRTFAITMVLRLLTVVVAFIGILSALTALQLERAREFAVLRAVGLTPRGLWALVTSQTVLMGLLAGLLALPLGLALAVILIDEINVLSFGWTMPLSVHALTLAEAPAFSLGAALLAGLVPALRMSRTPPSVALREE